MPSSRAALEPTRSRLLPFAAGALWGLLGLAVVLAAALWGRTPIGFVGAFAVAVAGLVLLPGYAAARALLPSPRSWNGMAGQAVGAGLVLSVFEWLAAVVGRSPLWAIGLAAAALGGLGFLAGRRGRLGFRPESRVSVPATAVMLAAVVIQGVNFANNLFGTALFPSTSRWYQDNLWHISIAGILRDQVVPNYPQALGDPLNYHWLANAHIALLNLVTDIPIDVLVMRLWFWPMLIGAPLLACAVCEVFVRRTWLGPLAGALVLCMPTLRLTDWLGLPGHLIWVPYSSSQTFAVPVLLFVVFCIAALLRGEGPGRGQIGLWATAAAAMLIAPGAKSSNLPMAAAGLALALLVSLLMRMQKRIIATLGGLLALCVLMTAATAPVFAGAGEGTKIRLFAAFYAVPQWFAFSRTVGGSEPAWIVRGPGDPLGATMLVLLVFTVLAAFAWALPGLAALRRGDEGPAEARAAAQWTMLGLGIAGFCAMMLVDHDGMSQFYFMRGAAAVLACFAVIGMDRLLSEAQTLPLLRRFVWIGLAAGVAAAAALWLVRLNTLRSTPDSQFIPGLLIQSGVFALMAALAVTAAVRPERRSARRLGLGVALSVAGLVAAPLSMVPDMLTKGRLTYSEGMAPPQDGITAARWIRDHTPRDAVVATNVHCYLVKTTKNCDTRTFWVSAASERQTYIEGWGYSAAAHAAHGTDGHSYARQPFHDPVRYAENEVAFSLADPASLQSLKSHGVTYLLATTEASPVSPLLKERAEEVFRDGRVSVYRLR